MEKWYKVFVYHRNAIIGAFTSLEAFNEVKDTIKLKEYDLEYNSGKLKSWIMLDENLEDFNLIKHD